MNRRIILVTGGNRGIGLEICRGIFQRADADNPVTVLVGCRSLENYAEPAAELERTAQEHSSKVEPIVIDVTDDLSIQRAVSAVAKEYGKLDVLINNAGWANIEKDITDFRQIYAKTMDINVASVAITSEYFLPLLFKSPNPRIIINSSGRGSLTLNAASTTPTLSAAYSASKAAVTLLGLELSKRFAVAKDGNPSIKVWSCNPGFCKTKFNNYRGTKDPADGALPLVELASAKEKDVAKYELGRMWEYEEGVMRIVPW